MSNLEANITTALENYLVNEDAMHIPPQDTDVDVVLSDCLKEIKSLKAQLAQLEAKLLKHQSDDYVLFPKMPHPHVFECGFTRFMGLDPKY